MPMRRGISRVRASRGSLPADEARQDEDRSDTRQVHGEHTPGALTPVHLGDEVRRRDIEEMSDEEREGEGQPSLRDVNNQGDERADDWRGGVGEEKGERRA